MAQTNQQIPRREDVPKEYTWAIEDVFANDEAFFAALDACSDLPAQVGAFAGKLGESAETLLAFLQLQDEITPRVHAIATYAFRKSDVDTANGKYLDMCGRAMRLIVSLDSAGAFATPEIMEISDERLAAFYAECAPLTLYTRHIDMIRRRKAHTLSAAEEALLAAAGEMAESPDGIGSALRNADMKFPDVTDSQGNAHQLTNGSYIRLLESGDRVLRERAFHTFYQTYGNIKNTAAALLDAQAKQLMYFARARKYGSTLEAALDATEVPVAVYHNLIQTVNDNLDPLYRYVRLRKKLLGVDELHMYDLYTTLVADAEKKFPFEEAKAAVLEGLAPLGSAYLDVLREGFSSRWIDVYENVGKRAGAYSAGAAPHPFVLLNHKDTLASMFTLAHEMGHALHSYHSKKTQPTVYADYVIFVAEVASTCNEVLLMRHLLAKTTDRKERAYLINHFLEQFRGTLYRQTMFAEFERDISAAAESGTKLTSEFLSDAYYRLNKKYFGEDIVVDDDIALEWSRIPHFFYNFYVFQYATGFSAAVALANRILNEGQSAVDAYLGFLSAGHSKDPIAILRDAGIDMASPQPISDALALFSELLTEMEALMA